MTITLDNVPDFDSLPPVKDMPKGCAWGLFDTNGKKDELGTLNLLTPDLIAQVAKSEIQTGKHVQLDWPLDAISFSRLRKKFEQKIVDLSTASGFIALDDEIHFNTQGGSQWDSCKHVWYLLNCN